ncbi:MAG: 3-deoxy-manno-octulosonate cytidylyltransferase [Rhodospirillales bacterium]
MKAIGIIPARMASSRYPGKPLVKILGKPMIEHVYRRCLACPGLDEVIIATCDEEIRSAAEAFGAPVAMTSDRHDRASDRIAEAAEQTDADVVVLIQGDEPMTHPDMITQALAPYRDGPGPACVNLTLPITDREEFENPNTIKVVIAKDGKALFMTRQPIPHKGLNPANGIYGHKQVCIIPFRRDALMLYAGMEQSPLEIAESVDMNRFLENGIEVVMVPTDRQTHAVDNAADRDRVEQLLAADPYTKTY